MTVELTTTPIPGEDLCNRCHRRPRKPGCKICADCAAYNRDYRRKRVEDGFCRICYLPHDDSTTACSKCLAEQASVERPEWMCSSCNNPHEPGKSWCARCISNDKRRRQERYDQGLCRCGREPRLPGRVLGRICNHAELRSCAARTRRSLKRKRCRNHPKEPLAPGNKYLCQKCVAGRAKADKKRTDEKKKAGICTRCKDKAVEGVLCPRHAELNRRRTQKHRAHRISKGVCLRCPAEATNGRMCAVHAEEHCLRQKGIK